MCVSGLFGGGTPDLKPAPLPLTPAPDGAESRAAADAAGRRRRMLRGFGDTIETSPTGAPTPASAIAVTRLLGRGG